MKRAIYVGPTIDENGMFFNFGMTGDAQPVSDGWLFMSDAGDLIWIGKGCLNDLYFPSL